MTTDFRYVQFSLPRESVDIMTRLLTEKIEDAVGTLQRGVRDNNQSVIAESEAILRCLEPIMKDLNRAQKCL